MSTFVGTGLLVRHALRRDRVLAGVWVLVLLPVMDALRAFQWAPRRKPRATSPATGAREGSLS